MPAKAKLIDRIASQIANEARMRRLKVAMREAESNVRSIPKNAPRFIPPEFREDPVQNRLRNSGTMCRHFKFKFERCSKCGRK